MWSLKKETHKIVCNSVNFTDIQLKSCVLVAETDHQETVSKQKIFVYILPTTIWSHELMDELLTCRK